MPSLACIGLGSNLGDRRGTLDGAIAALASTPAWSVRKVSSFHETEPVGGPPGQGMFLNAAAVLETTLDPFGLLHVLQEIEDAVRPGPDGPLGRADAGPRPAALRRSDHRHARADAFPIPAWRHADSSSSRSRKSRPTPSIPVTRRTIAELLADLERDTRLANSAGSSPCRWRWLRLYHSFTHGRTRPV